MMQTGLGFYHALYTVPPSRWSTIAIQTSPNMHAVMMFRLGISPVKGSFETHIFVPYFLILGLVIVAFGDMSRLNLAKLVLYYGSG